MIKTGKICGEFEMPQVANLRQWRKKMFMIATLGLYSSLNAQNLEVCELRCFTEIDNVDYYYSTFGSSF